jgi:multiple sugar transport system substrate-binding protein
LAIIGIGAFVYLRFFNNDGSDQNGQNTQTPKTEVTYWGLWEPTTVMSEVISEFEKQNPDYKITYVQQKPDQYRERLQTDIAQGKGPDIFRYHASWVPMMTSELSPLPEKIMTNAEFQQTFYPVAQRQLSTGGNIVGIPLMYEGLELFYNTQIFQVANVTPPKDWEEMKQVAQTLTVRSGNSITRAGIALGTANNVEHFSDILGLMLYQNKRKEDPQQFDLSNVSSKESQDALDFYVSFRET